MAFTRSLYSIDIIDRYISIDIIFCHETTLGRIKKAVVYMATEFELQPKTVIVAKRLLMKATDD